MNTRLDTCLSLGLLAALVVVLEGCAGAAISSSTYAIKSSRRDALIEPATRGDAQAQYQLGKLWCCMGPGFDTQTATEWLCRAALQRHPDALFELGRIYAGELSRTPAPGQKLMRMLTADSELAHALAFYKMAAQAGNADAVAKVASLDAEVDSGVRDHAQRLQTDFSQSCEYDSVFRASH